MNNTRNYAKLLESLRGTENPETRMRLLQGLTNEDHFELDKYLCYGTRSVEGTVCFPYRKGKYFNQKPTEKAPWIKNRFTALTHLDMEPIPYRDNYRTLNILYPDRMNRCKEDVHYINELYIDLDTVHKNGIPKSEQTRRLQSLCNFLINAFDNGDLPRPTSFLFSGRGYALHYILKDPIPTDSEEAISFSALYQCAFDKFEHLLETAPGEIKTDVDRVVHGLSRLGRVAGTLNVKAKQFSRFLDVTGHYFTIDELISGFVDDNDDFEIRKTLKRSGKGITKAAMVKYYANLELKKQKEMNVSGKTLEKIRKAKSTKRKYEESADALSEQKFSQWCHIALHGIWHLDTFFRYRKWVDGSGRYNYGLIYYNLARTLLDQDKAEYLLRRNVDKMEEPLDENTLERIIESTEDLILSRGYPMRFSYDKICEMLDIDPEMAEKCGLVSVTTRVKKAAENIQAAAERDREIMRMHNEGIPRKQIVETLMNTHPEWKISTRTVSRVLANYNDCTIEPGRTIYRSYHSVKSSDNSLNILNNQNIQTISECQHSSSVVIKNSESGASVGENPSRESILTELNSENSSSEKADNEFKEYILSVLRHGENVFLHGMGGTGKTYLLKQFIDYCNEAGRNVAVVTPTAVASTNYQKATTIHSFFHLDKGVIEETSINFMQVYALENVNVLIIDEISMVRCDLFDVVLYIISEAERQYHKKIQLILCGDVGQLPCVVTDDEANWLVQKYNSLRYMFFEAKRYQSLPLKHVLLEKNRRTNPCEALYAKIMRHIHDGDSRVLSLLNDRIISEQLKPQENTIVLAAHKSTINKINNTIIHEHMKDPSFMNITATGASSASDGEYPVPLLLSVFCGMKIMFVLNNPKHGYINGTMAEIVSIQKDHITVLVNGKQLKVKREEFISGIDKTASIKQFPFVPAYAITIHKSQGLSLDKAIIFPDCFDPGMLYTALSRLRSMNGLYLTSSIPKKSLITSSEAAAYMNSLNLITVENYITEQGMH